MTTTTAGSDLYDVIGRRRDVRAEFSGSLTGERVGPVTHLEQTPDLERHGWRRKRPLAEAIHHEKYGN
jgi:hypothetical protein